MGTHNKRAVTMAGCTRNEDKTLLSQRQKRKKAWEGPGDSGNKVARQASQLLCLCHRFAPRNQAFVALLIRRPVPLPARSSGDLLSLDIFLSISESCQLVKQDLLVG